MVKKYFLFGVLVSFFGCSTPPKQPVQIQASDIQSLVDEAMKNGNLPAIGVLVKHHGQELYFGVQGHRAIQFEDKAELNDMWHLGSDTKSMTAFLIALAVQDQKLDYSSKVTEFFPKFAIHMRNADLTIADLLVHQSGLKDVQEVQKGKLWKDAFKSKKDIAVQRLEMATAGLKELPHLDNNDKVKRNFSYANMNYVILGAILEKIYKTSWEDLMRKNLFAKLKMHACGFGVAGQVKEKTPSQPWAHAVEKGKLQGFAPKFKMDNPSMLGPAGTVHCSLLDWNKYISELISTYNGRGSLLKDKSVVTKYFSTSSSGHYTFGGWGKADKYKTIGYSHNGSNTFNYAIASFFPETGDVVLMVTNSGTAEAEAALTKLHKQILGLIIPLKDGRL